MKRDQKDNKFKNYKQYIPYFIGIVVTCLLVVGIGVQKYNETTYMSYQTFITQLEQHQIKEAMLSEGSMVRFEMIGDTTRYETDNPRTENFKELLLLHNVKVQETSVTSGVALVQSLLSTGLFLGMFYFVYKQVSRKNTGHAMSLQTQAVSPEDLKVGFSQIAGNVEAKEQVQDIISFIKNPDKYTSLGASMPKGLIFYGPPGTGKTLMAKAIAKEADVPFFSVSGSDFVQLYVGVGASRIRDIFSEARKHEKAIIFIDEIDAIGKKRSQNPTGSNDEKDQTLNALLTEMSGFKKEDGIVVVAATNRLELLDDALLRPGRFDRHIEIGYPDKNARKQIISLYLKDKPVDDTVDREEILKQTVYFTGAMLENLMNEAAIVAANEGAQAITQRHMDKAFYTVVAGQEKKDTSHITQEERRITAYHEAGHALVTKLIAPENSVAKVTIIPTAKGAGGFSMNVPKDKMYHTKTDFENQIKISLGGRIAEEIIFGEAYITTGASNDIEKATRYLKDYIGKYGMHDGIGMLNLEVLIGAQKAEQQFLTLYQEKMAELYNETHSLVQAHIVKLHHLAETLLEEETLNEMMVDTIMSA